MKDNFEDRKTRASAWLRSLRDEIVAAFEALEDTQTSDLPAGRFEVTQTKRHSDDGQDAGGGLMSVMRGGRVFEKVGVNVSTVYGQLGPRAVAAMAARKDLSGLKDDPTFWAAGISLVAHMRNPHAPAVHMNTRMFWTPVASWFGGGTDLNPAIEYVEDTAHFHDVLRDHCAPHAPDSTTASRLGRMSISMSRTAIARAALVAFSMTICTPAIGRRISPLPKMSVAPFCLPSCHWLKNVGIAPGPRMTARRN